MFLSRTAKAKADAAAPLRQHRFPRLNAFKKNIFRFNRTTAAPLPIAPADSTSPGESSGELITTLIPPLSENLSSTILPTTSLGEPSATPTPPPSSISPIEEPPKILIPSPLTKPKASTSALAGPTLPSSSRAASLWRTAIKNLPKEDQEAFDFDNLDGLKILDAVLKATEDKREICRENMWKITWKGEKIILRDVADKIITWVNKFKTLGNTVAQCDPAHTAMPWALVQYLLGVATKDFQKMGEMLVGIEVITNLIGRCAIYEELYLRTGFNTAQRVEEALVVLYTDMLTYLINAKHYYAKNTIVRVAGCLLDGNELAEALAAIQSKESDIFKETHLAEAKNQIAANKVLEERATDLYTLLEGFRMPIVRVERNMEVLIDGLESTERQKILDWISKVPYTKYHRTAKDRRKEGTCGWLLERHEFREWQMSSASTVFWLRGDPGAGKTTLTSMVVDAALRNQEVTGNDEALAYFYCKRGEALLSDPADIMRSIVRQLSLKSAGSALQKPVVIEHEKNMTGKAFDDGLGIKQCLSLIVSLIDLNLHTTIIIDALDECDNAKRHELFSGLREIINSSTSLVKIFISSRNDDDIKFQFKNYPNIYIEENDNSTDIESYVHENVKLCIEEGRLLHGKLKVDDPLGKLVVSRLLEKARGMFLWVELQINALCTLRFESDVRAMLDNFPNSLEETYEDICKRIELEKGTGPEIAKKALMWVMCSYRPLSPDELTSVISPHSPDTIIEMDVLLHMCHNFLKVDPQLNVVRFFHLSVEEFFEKEAYFGVLEANAMVAEFCLGRLCNLSGLASSQYIEEYPALYWSTHVQRCSSKESDDKIWQMLKTFFGSFNKPSSAYSNWVQQAQDLCEQKWEAEIPLLCYTTSYLTQFPEAYNSPPSLASRFGFGEGIKDLWDEKTLDPNLKDFGNESLLNVASYNGHEMVAKMLLERGADVNAQGGEYGNALQAAASSESEKLVRTLLENGADVNAQGGYYGNALQAAASTGSEKVVQILLENGADVNAQGGEYGNALQAAAESGSEKVVQILLENGANVNAQGGEYGNALQAAASIGSELLVQMLLENKADVNARGGEYGNALQAATELGSEKVVQILLKNGADANARDGYYGNALYAAALRGNKKIVQLLLENGADVNVQGGEYGSALQAAAPSGSEDMVQILLENGADVNAQGGYYGNALQAAAERGNEKVVQILLDNGANANAQGGRYGNALQAAASMESEKVVQILLENGADVNAQGGEYGNALQAAAERGSKNVVQILLESGADVNAQGGHYGNALQAAASMGSDKVTQLLLKNGADVSAQGGRYGNALQAAAERGSEKVVQILLENGADVNAQGGYYGNALYAAVSKWNRRVAQILLENGADTNNLSPQAYKAFQRWFPNGIQTAKSSNHKNKEMEVELDTL